MSKWRNKHLALDPKRLKVLKKQLPTKQSKNNYEVSLKQYLAHRGFTPKEIMDVFTRELPAGEG